ncbi:MAG: hypothetical protein ACI4S3_07290 [Candidatus Gastranaerophilaceae bacterium]
MNIQERIRYFSEKMNLNFIVKNYIKLSELEKEIRRNLKKELNGKGKVLFTSQDLRILCISLDKVHKALNKKVSFVEFQKRFNKYDKVRNSALIEETKQLAQYLLAVREVQKLLNLFNYYAVNLYLQELQKEQIKQADDDLFNDMVLMGIIEAM